MRVVILSAGYIDYSHLPVGTNTSNAMIPINGKPVIQWILEDLKEKGVEHITLVMRSDDELLKRFVDNIYTHHLNLECVEINASRSILDSLEHGLFTVEDKEVGVLLGDTLIRDQFYGTEDFVYIQEVEDSHRWCLAVTNEKNQVVKYLDKVHGAAQPHFALCGYYFFKDISLLKAALSSCIQSGHRQLSNLLTEYQKHKSFKAVKASSWYDFGNIDNLIKSKQKLLQSRYFNALTVDPLLNTITKISEFDEKLRNELNWYESIPDALKVLSPRIISKQEVKGQLHLVQEYYGYPTVAELFVYSDIDIEIWSTIFVKLLDIHGVFRSHEYAIDQADCYDVYYHKTFERLKKLQETDAYWKMLLTAKEVNINGSTLPGFCVLEEQLKKAIEKLIAGAQGAVIHGDYCFSNILFDYGNQIIRLIDPRGSFGKIGVYGDSRYDIAKLRHSVCGRYDLIVSDLFTLSTEGNSFNYSYFPLKNYEALAATFDDLLVSRGFDLADIKLIEGLLFISMLPLHQDKPLRQRMMFCRGIQLLNEVLLTK